MREPTLGGVIDAGRRVRQREQAQARLVMELGDLAIHVANWVGPHRAFVQVDGEQRRAYLTEETWDTISSDPQASDWFFDHAREGGEGMRRFTVDDVGPYAAAARKEAPQPDGRDRLDALLDESRALLVQVASLNQAASPLQLQVFAERRTELIQRARALADVFAEVDAALDLAATAIVDASD